MNENEQQPQEQPLEETLEKEGGNKSGGVGALIGAIIIVFILLGLGFYIFTNRDTQEPQTDTSAIEEGIVNLPDQQREELEDQSMSDALSTIEEDVNDTDLNNLDAELQAIEEELNEL